MGPEPPLELRCIGLDPAKDGGVCEVSTAFFQHELEVAVADREHKVPAHRPEDYLSGELPAFEGQTRLKCRQSPPCHVPAWLRSPRPVNDATEPISGQTCQATQILAQYSQTAWLMTSAGKRYPG